MKRMIEHTQPQFARLLDANLPFLVTRCANGKLGQQIVLQFRARGHLHMTGSAIRLQLEMQRVREIGRTRHATQGNEDDQPL